MVFRPTLFVLAACLSGGCALAQSNAMLDGTKASAPQPNGPPLSPETRGDIYMARKMYREAIDAFREGSPKDPVLLNKQGIAFHQLLKLDDARKSYEQAVKLKPDYVEAINNLGTIYYTKKNFRRAISYYNRALKLAPEQPKSASINMNLDTAYFARKRFEQASGAYQTALRLDPDVFERHGNFGVMLEERTVEDRAKFHYYLAKLYAKDGRNELALQYLRKALEEGFKDRKKLDEDSEFEAVRKLPEDKELMAAEHRVL